MWLSRVTRPVSGPLQFPDVSCPKLLPFCAYADFSPTWIYVEQAGMVAASADRNESARARRKRQQTVGVVCASGSGAAGPSAAAAAASSAPGAAWANLKSQKRFFG